MVIPNNFSPGKIQIEKTTGLKLIGFRVSLFPVLSLSLKQCSHAVCQAQLPVAKFSWG